MSKNFLDLKKFKHIKSDDDSTTLQHKDGHILRVAHKALSKDFQKQLSALSQMSKDDKTEAQAEESKADKQMYADGGVAAPDESSEINAGGSGSPQGAGKSGGGGDIIGTVMKLAPLIAAASKGGKVPYADGGDIADSVPEEGKQALANYVDAPSEAEQNLKDAQAAIKITPEMMRMASGVAMGSLGPVEGLAEEAAPVAKQALEAVVPMAEKTFGRLPAMIEEQAAHAGELAEQLGDYHPLVQKAYKMLNSLKDQANAYKVKGMKYAEGGAVDPQMDQQQDPNAQQMQPPLPVDVKPNPYAEMYNKTYAQIRQNNPGEPEAWARKSALNAAESQSAADQANVKIAREDAEAQQQQIMEENQRRQSIGLGPIPVPSVPDLPTSQNPVMSPKADATLTPIKSATNDIREVKGEDPLTGGESRDPESMLESGYQKQVSGLNAEAQAQGQLGQQQAEVLNKNIQDQNVAKDSFLQSYRQLEQERQDHMQDIKDGYIDPNAYWKDHSKLRTGIGMILAGFQPNGGPNAAINFLQYQMNNNLEAQRQNLGAKQNLLSANLRQFGNLRDGMDMTRLMQNDIMQHELQAAAAKSMSPMAKAQAMKAIGQLQMQSAPLFQQFALRRAMVNLSNNGGSPNSIDHLLGYMRVTNPEMAKEMESRYVPQVGLANIPVPEKVRGDLIAKQNFQLALQDLRNWTAGHSGSINPAAIAEGRTKAANVQNLYREAINGGVFKQGEQAFLSGIVDAKPDKFFNSIRVMPKLNEVIRQNDASMNVMKKAYGLPAQQQSQSQQPQYKMVNGVKYMRGPHGEAIKVK